ncbi:MAG: T9SS type A sorting domain-containing protein [Flavobacteriales bacterium]
MRRVVLCSALSAAGPGAIAQNTFFSVYDMGTGATFDKVRRCANGDYVCMSDEWNLMLRTDSMGNVLWANYSPSFASTRSGAPVEAANGDLLVLSAEYDTATTRFNMALVRMDATGNILAADAFPVDTISFLPWRSAPLSNGMIAHIATAWNSQEVVIMVFDPGGPYAYPRIRIPVNFPTQGNLPAGFTGVFAGPQGSFFTYHGSYQPTLILTKYSTTGVAYWSKSYVVDGGNSTIGMAGTLLANGNVALLVESLSLGPDGEYLLLLNPSGDVVSARKLYDADNAFDWRGHVVPMPDGSFVVHLARVEVDPTESDIVLHMDANANVIAQYGFEPGVSVQDVIAVDNDRIALVCRDAGSLSLSVMDFNGPLPTCWQYDSVSVSTVVATASTVTVTSSSYTSAPLPASFANVPATVPRTPMCSSLAVGTPQAVATLELFPSPTADGRITVQAPGLSPGCRYEVIDARGVRCAEGRLPVDATLDLVHLARGTYMLRLLLQDGVCTARFVR